MKRNHIWFELMWDGDINCQILWQIVTLADQNFTQKRYKILGTPKLILYWQCFNDEDYIQISFPSIHQLNCQALKQGSLIHATSLSFQHASQWVVTGKRFLWGSKATLGSKGICYTMIYFLWVSFLHISLCFYWRQYHLMYIKKKEAVYIREHK